ncbi:hypothetical protein CP09DC79_1167, partial [Chlamydia psittaci 09DC79]
MSQSKSVSDGQNRFELFK